MNCFSDVYIVDNLEPESDWIDEIDLTDPGQRHKWEPVHQGCLDRAINLIEKAPL